MVTGGAGFIGSHLCERLLARGDEVLCVDNFFTFRRQNIAHLRGNPLFEFMRHDITWPLYVEVDRIYNLACPASPVHYQFDPVQTTKTSVHGAINMLGLANRLKKLHGKREGRHSIRVNDQWRPCFVWREGNAYDVEVVDYH